MFREYSIVFKRLTICADACIVGCAFCLGYFLQANDDITTFTRYASILPIFAGIWVMTLYFSRMYESFRIKPINEIAMITLKAALFTLIFFISFIFMFNLTYINRGVLIFSIVLSMVFILIEKIMLISVIRIIRKKGYNYRNLLIIGTGERAKKLVSLIEEHNEWGFKIIGMVDKDPFRKGLIVSGCEVIGSFEDMPDIVSNNVVDEVVFVIPRSWICDIEDVMCLCETQGIRVHVALDYFNLKLCRPLQSDLHGFPLLTFQCTPTQVWSLFIKRLLDIVISGMALVLLFPLFGIVAMAIKLTSEGPILFWQERCGLNGRRFKFYKFRTMFKDAEGKLESLRKFNEMEGPVFKMKNDPRITTIGRFLRKLSVDELPQLWHVLNGDMSLVGPRPPIPEEVKKYDYWQRRRLSMKPGLSCLWQVKGRNRIRDFEEWMKLDLEYIDNWSLWLDIDILLRTVPVVLFGIGAG